MQKLFILIAFFTLSTQLHGASITYKKTMLDQYILIEGDIEKGDKDKLLKELRMWSSNRQKNSLLMPRIDITSNGGDFEEAMKIGLLIRRSLVIVMSVDPCYSACSLIIFSSVDRHRSSYTGSPARIGIHRPYYDKEYFSSLTMVKANEKYSNLIRKTRSFLMDMNIPTNITEKMFETPSDKIYNLNMTEWRQIRGKSPAFEEWINSQCVDLTDAEYIDKVRSMRTGYFNDDRSMRPSDLSQGYEDYLWGKHTVYIECRDAATYREFEKTIQAWD